MLKKNQKMFIWAMSQSGSITEACEKANICRATYYTWLKDPKFVEYLEVLQHLIHSNFVIKMQELYKKSAKKFESLLDSENDHVSLKVAMHFLKNSDKFMEITPNRFTPEAFGLYEGTEIALRREEEEAEDLFERIAKQAEVFEKIAKKF